MKKLNQLFLLALLVLITSCAKEKRITRKLSGESYMIVKVTTTYFYPGSPSKVVVTSGDNTVIKFEKDGACTVGSEKGYYSVTGAIGEEEGFLNIDTENDYAHYTINEFNRKTMVLTDEGEYYSAYGEGYIVVVELEKL